jgi:hypothetical protein
MISYKNYSNVQKLLSTLILMWASLNINKSLRKKLITSLWAFPLSSSSSEFGPLFEFFLMNFLAVPTDDPLTLALVPPVDETEEERRARKEAEVEAKRISDEIDRKIDREREEEGKRKKPLKVILAGERNDELYIYGSDVWNSYVITLFFKVRVEVGKLL